MSASIILFDAVVCALPTMVFAAVRGGRITPAKLWTPAPAALSFRRLPGFL
jgi:hypothetical protein